jgi:hypothetical protein
MNAQSPGKVKFVNDIWVTAYYDGLYVIGRTYMHAKTGYVSIVTELATTEEIPWDDLTNIKALSIKGQEKPASKAQPKRKRLSRMFMEEFMDINLN